MYTNFIACIFIAEMRMPMNREGNNIAFMVSPAQVAEFLLQ